MIGKSIANLSLKLDTSSAFAIHGQEQSHRKSCTKSAKGEGNLGIQLSQWNKWHHCTNEASSFYRMSRWRRDTQMSDIYKNVLVTAWFNTVMSEQVLWRSSVSRRKKMGHSNNDDATSASRNWSYVWSTARCLSRPSSGCGNYTAVGTPLVYLIWCLLSALSRSRLVYDQWLLLRNSEIHP